MRHISKKSSDAMESLDALKIYVKVFPNTPINVLHGNIQVNY